MHYGPCGTLSGAPVWWLLMMARCLFGAKSSATSMMASTDQLTSALPQCYGPDEIERYVVGVGEYIREKVREDGEGRGYEKEREERWVEERKDRKKSWRKKRETEERGGRSREKKEKEWKREEKERRETKRKREKGDTREERDQIEIDRGEREGAGILPPNQAQYLFIL